MNGVHDVGGMHGFGEVERAPGPPSLERWEAAIIAINSAVGAAYLRSIDDFRFAIERMDPQDYLNTTYFEHWLDGTIRTLTEKGVVGSGEIQRRMAIFADDPAAPSESAFNGQPSYVFPSKPVVSGYRREPDASPLFAPGDAVLTRSFARAGHTRLARFARGKRGVVAAHNGCHVFPDSTAAGLGEDPQHIYSVRFEASELWGEDAGPRESVYLDLWEPYLRRA